MFNNVLVLAFIAGLCFGGWPIIVRATTLSTNWIAVSISFGALIVVIGVMMKTGTIMPSVKNLLIGLMAGIINGFGFLVYAKLIGTKSIQLSVALPLVAVTLVIFVALAGILIYKEPITFKKLIGLMGAITAVILLR